jgi:hypothetical protein
MDLMLLNIFLELIKNLIKIYKIYRSNKNRKKFKFIIINKMINKKVMKLKNY